MHRFLCLGLFVAVLLPRMLADDADVRPLAGTWRYDPSRSTELSGWQSLQLVIAVDGPRVSLTWEYAAGRRTYADVIALDLSKSVNLVPTDMWPSNRHIGAYIGGDKTQKFKFRVLNNGRLLRTYADFMMATQQGEHPVNVVREYKASPNGQQLTLTELRNTRDNPTIYVFQRVPEEAGVTTPVRGN